MKKNINKEMIYDAIIIGGGISGITTAYMLRDMNILLLEKEKRFGGRVLSEEVFETTNNICTQFFSEGDSSFVNLVNELDIERVSHSPKSVPYAFFIKGQFYPNMKSFMNMGIKMDRLKLFARVIPRIRDFLKPQDHPKWKKLVGQNIVNLESGLRNDTRALVKSYMRGTCLAKPEHTSAGIGSVIMVGVFAMGEVAYVKGGFQKITDGMLDVIDDKVIKGAEVTKVEEIDDVVYTHFMVDGETQVVKSNKAVMTAPALVVMDLIPNLPDWKREALKGVRYGPLTMVSVIFKRDVPWERFFSLISDDTIFQMMFDQTLDTEDDNNPNNPIVCNFIISKYPDELEEIEQLLSLTDEEIVEQTLTDFKRIIPLADKADDYIVDTKVTRYPLGEIELSPKYYTECLPHLSKPVGNILFAGDYTHHVSFVEGAVYSAFEAARALDSRFVVSKEEEYYIKLPSLKRLFGSKKKYHKNIKEVAK
jgi:oxygen-dependent protoporphyrinogen oxidase